MLIRSTPPWRKDLVCKQVNRRRKSTRKIIKIESWKERSVDRQVRNRNILLPRFSPSQRRMLINSKWAFCPRLQRNQKQEELLPSLESVSRHHNLNWLSFLSQESHLLGSLSPTKLYCEWQILSPWSLAKHKIYYVNTAKSFCTSLSLSTLISSLYYFVVVHCFQRKQSSLTKMAAYCFFISE